MKMGPLKIVMGALCAVLGLTLGCKDSGKVSTERAAHHVATLAETVKVDVEEIRRGLPEGAKTLVPLFRAHRPAAVQGAPAGSGSAAALPSAAAPAASAVASPKPAASARPAASSGVAEAGTPRETMPDAAAAREALLKTRDKVQDLRVAKATFFALTDPNAIVLRNDQEQDLMATKPLLPFYPELRRALTGKYVEGRGSMPEAAGVRGRADGQWVAAQPVMVEGRVRALYVAGWSWSAYALPTGDLDPGYRSFRAAAERERTLALRARHRGQGGLRRSRVTGRGPAGSQGARPAVPDSRTKRCGPVHSRSPIGPTAWPSSSRRYSAPAWPLRFFAARSDPPSGLGCQLGGRRRRLGMRASGSGPSRPKRCSPATMPKSPATVITDPSAAHPPALSAMPVVVRSRSSAEQGAVVPLRIPTNHAHLGPPAATAFRPRVVMATKGSQLPGLSLAL